MGNDAQLVALLDGELDEETASRLLARIASDANLQNRYDALREVGSWLNSAFDWLLEEAPVSRLRTVLQRERPGRKAWPPLACVPFRAMTFAVALCIVAAGVGAGLALNSTTSSKEDWRSAVADYTNLYTNETFSRLHPDASLEAIELGAVGQSVGAKLTPETVALRISGSLSHSCSPSKVRHWARLPMWTLRAHRSCFASSPIMGRTPRSGLSAAVTSRSHPGRAKDADIS